ncbi:16S rRNA (cytosine(1402)-N(4))-methyltransferase RsmH [Candidatus Collierbacteria bacterium]|nr:16S rRNA (cytosine(1402)-N(4))-methyltransferase RsmH [Candidatus Collierbacteria bacterium]
MENSSKHVAVLLKETVDLLNIKTGEKYIDATLGGGGHTAEILKRGGKVLGLDRDEEAIKRLRKRFEIEIEEGRLIVMKGNFINMENIAKENEFDKVDGIIFDLGMSSDQFESGRGFSFMKDEPLDMRMDSDLGVTAADLVNALSQKELFGLFTKLAQVEKAREISGAIVESRKFRQVKTTKELVEIIGSVPAYRRQKDLHPATKVFMALRIAVNNEPENLEMGIPQASELLTTGGRLAVISFHQGEDRIVKQFFRKWQINGVKEINRKPILAEDEEVRINPRSRSAKLRVGEKI